MQDEPTNSNALTKALVIVFGVMTPSAPIPVAQRHPRDALPANPNGTAMRTCRGHAANTRERSSKIKANTVRPPDPPLKTRTLRYAFEKKAHEA